MARRHRGGRVQNGTDGGSDGVDHDGSTTGRFLVLLRDDEGGAGAKVLADKVGLKLARSRDFKAGATPSRVVGAGGVVYDEVGVAVVDADPDQYRSLAAVENHAGAIAIVEPERVVYALETNGVQPDGAGSQPAMPFQVAQSLAPAKLGPPAAFALDLPPPMALSRDYLEGVRDAAEGFLKRIDGSTDQSRELRNAIERMRSLGENKFTWGLQLTGVARSPASGTGIRVAVLDTGIDTGHPDFAGRSITTQSFVPGQAVQDLNGHGTHCIGTACGAQRPAASPRYGIAYGANIFAGKVLSNQGSGGDGGIVAGINWALANSCRVVSMSLGAPVGVGQSYSKVFETVARRCLSRGTLIVAAAGNESERPGSIAPVAHPANCPSIMAVAAVDVALRVAQFSCGDRNGGGGQVDIAGPGVGVHSTWPMPTRYRRIDGTSMATPHVAGIAALFAQMNPSASASDLWRMLIQAARRLNLPASDVGAGLVQAP